METRNNCRMSFVLFVFYFVKTTKSIKKSDTTTNQTMDGWMAILIQIENACERERESKSKRPQSKS